MCIVRCVVTPTRKQRAYGTEHASAEYLKIYIYIYIRMRAVNCKTQRIVRERIRGLGKKIRTFCLKKIQILPVRLYRMEYGHFKRNGLVEVKCCRAREKN